MIIRDKIEEICEYIELDINENKKECFKANLLYG